jgi:hypothetical protein
MSKQSVATGTVIMGILYGLVTKKYISDEEYRTVLERLGQASLLNEDTINESVQGIRNAEFVAATLRKQLLQQNAGPAPEPKPVVPIMQPAVSAETEVQENMVSSPFPTTSLTERLAGVALDKVLANLNKD